VAEQVHIVRRLLFLPEKSEHFHGSYDSPQPHPRFERFNEHFPNPLVHALRKTQAIRPAAQAERLVAGPPGWMAKT